LTHNVVIFNDQNTNGFFFHSCSFACARVSGVAGT
jgi:hypothetical protein